MPTKTWSGSWTTTSLQPSPAPRTPASTHSSATWTCTVVASQDPCMGEAPPSRGGGGGLQGTQPLKPLSNPLLPSALASGCPHHGPTRSTWVVLLGCSPYRALALMSTCGSVTSMAGRKASASDLTAPDLLTCQAWATYPARTWARQGATLLHTLLHLGS